MRKICFLVAFIANTLLILAEGNTMELTSLVLTSEGNFRISAKSSEEDEAEILSVRVVKLTEKDSTDVCDVKLLTRSYNCPVDLLNELEPVDNGFRVQFVSCADYLFVTTDLTFVFDQASKEFVCISYVESYVDRQEPDKEIKPKEYKVSRVKLRDFTEDTLWNLSKGK